MSPLPCIIMSLVEPNFVDFPWELLPIGRRGWRWGGGKVVGQDGGRTVDGCKRKLKKIKIKKENEGKIKPYLDKQKMAFVYSFYVIKTDLTFVTVLLP